MHGRPIPYHRKLIQQKFELTIVGTWAMPRKVLEHRIKAIALWQILLALINVSDFVNTCI